MRTLWAAGIVVWCAAAGVVDRIAVVVGKDVITESEVLQEMRLTGFLNGQPLDLGPEQRRAAAERLVDQRLIFNEMQIGRYPEPTAAEADAMVRKFRQEHYAGVPQFREALAKYGIAEDQLKQRLLWQLAALRFTDQRFRAGAPEPAAAGGANRLASGANTASDGDAVDRQMGAWLKEARSQTRVQFKKEAFQ